MTRHTPAAEPVTDDLVWDDALWDEVWERTLDQVERMHITRDVVLRRPHGDAFEARIGRELTRRLRGRAVTLAVVWGLFTAFWTMLAHLAVEDPGVSAAAPIAMVVLGGTVVVGCLAFRHRLARST